MTDGEVSTSLLGQLAKGKSEAAIVKPLVDVCEDIRSLQNAQLAIDESRSQLKILEELASPLDELKRLSKYAEAVVKTEFDAIKGTTTANLRHLYPQTSTGIAPGNLKLGKGRDKTVEALLTSTSFEARDSISPMPGYGAPSRWPFISLCWISMAGASASS